MGIMHTEKRCKQTTVLKPKSRSSKARKEKVQDEFLGRLKGKIRIIGDIVSPITPPEDWETLK
jgi:hypothetical protein